MPIRTTFPEFYAIFMWPSQKHKIRVFNAQGYLTWLLNKIILCTKIKKQLQENGLSTGAPSTPQQTKYISY
jgi:hypothetical protein